MEQTKILSIFKSFVNERERKKERERGRSELKQYSTFILSTLISLPMRRREDRRERERGRARVQKTNLAA